MKAEALGLPIGADDNINNSVVSPAERPNIAVGIATSGRKKILSHTLDLIAQQTRLPDILVVCPTELDDIEDATIESFPFTTAVRLGKRGLTCQRNVILSAAINSDIIVFFDDDFFPHPDYLAEIEKTFISNADVVAATGRPMQDGANGPGLTAEEASAMIFADVRKAANPVVSPTYGTYGCNMAFRMRPIREHGLSFDENLPLYGWQEDIDFSRQLSPFGRIIESDALCGVHLGAKGGRTSGVRFGYSQIANPIYLIRKQTISIAFGWSLMWRNVLANLAKGFSPEPWVDRRGRLKGNYLALIDLALGRISPQRILHLD
jgi:GT2 family glycosyltransferase